MTALSVRDPWEDDLLSRKQYADFLTSYIDRRCASDGSGMVVALDAAWGFGKTFFVSRWASQLSLAGRPHLFFNAWENDSAEDPAVSFMAELKKRFEPLYGTGGNNQAAAEVQQKARELVSSLRKATMPALVVVGKALLKKATGVAVDEFLNADNDHLGLDAMADIEHAAPDALEKGLDAFFDKALKAHTERLQSVRAFRKSLEELLALLQASGVLNGPLYVFIDELDRCRPDYAIELLEGIKHLFSVRGVAFVVSTNLDQLSKAIGAVYGPAFDGFQYLKRFFDFEYELPEPPRAGFISVQLRDGKLMQLGGTSGLDEALPQADKGVVAAFRCIADAMRLDLRALQRVSAIAEAAAAGAKDSNHLVPLWLFFLAALRHLDPTAFHTVARKSLTVQGFAALCDGLFVGVNRVPCLERGERGPTNPSDVPLTRVLEILYEATLKSTRDVRKIADGTDPWTTPYPAVLRSWLIADLRTYGKFLPLAEVPALINAAGYIKN